MIRTVEVFPLKKDIRTNGRWYDFIGFYLSLWTICILVLDQVKVKSISDIGW